MKSLYIWCLIQTIILANVTSWSLISSSLYDLQKFTCSYYYCANQWMTVKYSSMANYITCTTPAYSIVYLDGSTNKKFALYQFPSTSYPRAYYLLSIDFFFMGLWQNEQVSIEVRSSSLVHWSTSFTYTKSTYTMHNFCDTREYDMQRHYYQITPNANGDLFINITSSQGKLSFRNVFISYLKCHFSCKTCSGDKETECLTCFNGLPINFNGTCSSCPITKPYIYLQGYCQNYCDAQQRPNEYNVCSSISDSVYTSNQFSSSTTTQFANLMRFWDQTYDPKHIDDSSKQNYCNGLLYGPFTTRAGIFRSLTFYSNRIYPARIIAELAIFGTLNLYSGIHFKLNNIYYGSLFMGQSGYEGHNLIITQQYSYTQTCSIFSTVTRIAIQLSTPITPTGNGLISVVGNLTDPNTEAWGLYQITLYGSNLPNYCSKVNTFYQCLECQSNAFLYRYACYYFSTSTSWSCPQRSYKSTNKCIFYDEESKYAKFYLQAYNSYTPFGDMDTLFDLVNQTGTNFLLGPTNFTSYTLGTYQYRIFGGNLIWSQAAFTKTYTIQEPHFAVAVRFTVIFGWNFGDGEFRYDIENQGQKNVSLSNCTGTFDLLSNNSMVSFYQVYEKFDHSSSTVSVTVNCVGTSNSVYDAFCAIMEYYIVVSYCQPFCDECTDDVTCLTWNSTYDSTSIVFDGSTCLSNQYFDPLQYKCLDCHEYCPTCLTRTTCTSCIDTLQLNVNECGCGIQQYKNTVSTPHSCVDCTLPCITCISDTECTDCSADAHRILIHNKCVCIDGYYDDGVDCQKCNLYCTTCTGPTNGECNSCLDINNFILNDHLCKCDQHFYFFMNQCQACDESCLTCYGSSQSQCLSCDSSVNRKIKGNQCVCDVGYKSSSTIPANCDGCPTSENSSYIECYKTCGDGSSIWHNISCPIVSCSSGYTNVNNQCIPICGDNLIVGYEECDDGNQIQEDGCYNCAFQCQQQCLTCDSLTVFPCQDICGDGVISGTEQCDDMNDEMYDGCYDCQYQCQPQCTQCIQGSCYECATYGWKVNTSDMTCIENCGDYIVVNREQCDDGNNSNIDDGCDQCRYRCRSECLQCNNVGNFCLLCEDGFSPYNYYCKNICGDGLVVSNAFNTEECDDGNTIGSDGCSSTCQWQCQPTSICTTCSSNKCLACVTGYQLKTSENRCDSVCGDSIVIANEICDDSNSLLYDGCYKCQYQCDIHCSNCNLGKCTECISGYRLNLYNRRCEPICNDNIIVVGEECDDNNKIPFDGCYNCQYSCPLFCQLCTMGKCYQCQDGFILRFGKCQPICGNNQLNLSEQCDNGDWNCQNCQLKCQRECISCQSGICTQCQDGYILNQNKCEAVSIIHKQIENCVFQIKEECKECAQYYILEYNECKFNFKCSVNNSESCNINNENVQCLPKYSFNSILNQCEYIEIQQEQYCEQQYEYEQLGYYLQEGICQSICENSMKAHDEQCDDDNNNLIGGCLGCKLTCYQYCQACDISGICLICQEGYFLTIFNLCIPILGDEKVTINKICNQTQQIGSFNQYFNGDFSCDELFVQQAQIQGQQCNNLKGYYLNPLTLQCESQCGDQIVSFDEECDSNSISCKNCQFSCSENCIMCSYGLCYVCNQGFQLVGNQCQAFCGDGLVIENEQCDDSNIEPYDGCYNCQFSCQQECTSCVNGRCQECETVGWELDKLNEMCVSICGDSLVVGYEQCDDGNLTSQDGCYECKLECQDECTQCQSGACVECNTDGWYLNIKLCESLCGDSIVVGNEQCDDGNDIRYDGCYNCQFDCQKSCLTCHYGYCFLCDVGWSFNEYKCDPICGDSIVVEVEECDDGNDLPNDGCYQCKYSCDVNCQQCGAGVCEICKSGWEISSSGVCSPICGDKLVQVGYEDCDDGNIVEFDGCFNCQYQCHEACTQCVNGACQQCNTLGWTVGQETQQCIPLCGDGIIIAPEQCDDQNAIPYDGCYDCKYQCHQKCKICNEGYCLQCQLGWYQDSEQCTTTCGDGIYVSETEQCDDGNVADGDGCSSSCQQEYLYGCTNSEHLPSVCLFEESPKIILAETAYNDYSSNCSLTFNQKMKYQKEFSSIKNYSEHISVELLTYLPSDYKIEIYPITEPSEIASNVEFIIKITFNVQCVYPQILVSLENNLDSVYGRQLTTFEAKLGVSDPRLLSQESKQKAELLSQFSQNIMISIGVVSIISILTCSTVMFQNMLNQLQFLSYIKYVNVVFPENLQIYFDAFSIVSLDPLLKLLKVDVLINSLNGEDESYIQPQDKFANDGINGYFFDNFASFIFCISSAYFSYYISKFGTWCLYRIKNRKLNKFSGFKKQVIINVRKKLKEIQKEFYYSGLIQIFLANYYDISFATLIQITNLNFSTVNFTINSISSILICFGQVFLTYKLLTQATQFIKQTTFLKKGQFSALFEGIGVKSQLFWSMQMNTLLLIKKFFFMVVIIVVQDYGAIQSVTIALLSTFYLVYLIKGQPIANIYEYKKAIISESITIFNTLTFLVYAFSKQYDIPYSFQLIIGWIHISSLTSQLVSTFLIDFAQQSSLLYDKFVLTMKQHPIYNMDQTMFYT